MDAVRRLTIGAGKALTSSWPAGYNVSLHGPNGFVRKYAGSAASASAATVLFREEGGARAPGTTVAAVLQLKASSSAGVGVSIGCKLSAEVRDNSYTHGGPWDFELPTVATASVPAHRVPTASSGNWYDLTVTTTVGCPGASEQRFARRFMGKIETTHATTTDPAMAKNPGDMAGPHPELSLAVRTEPTTAYAAQKLGRSDLSICEAAYSKDACYSP